MKNTFPTLHIIDWLNVNSIPDPVNRRMATLLQVMLIGFISIIVIASVLNVLISPSNPSPQLVLIRGAIFSLIIGIPLVLLRRGHFRSSVLIIIAIFFLLETFAVLSVGLREVAETLSFFTLAIILSGLLLKRRALLITYFLAAGVVSLGAYREQGINPESDGITIALNFILLHGLMSVFLGQFGVTLRAALNAALEREQELQNEINIRKQAEAAVQFSTERLEILHEIDRSLLAARSQREIALAALVRIRKLIFCPRASVTLIDLSKNEAKFLAAHFDGTEIIADTPITLQEFGQRIIDALQQNNSWLANDILNDPQATELDKRLAEESGIHAWLCLPLMYQGQLIGALNLGRGVGEFFTAEDAEIAHDIANQLAIAIQHINLYNALQNELMERKKLILELEANNAELERFTYTVSHDLRNPLVTIKGFLGMLQKDLRENRADKIQSDFQRIANASDKMDELLSDLLELSRIGRVLNPLEEVDLTKLTQEAIEALDARIRSRNVALRISSDLPVMYGDRIRLREVLENLIDNAAKYMGDQRNPIIEIGAMKWDGDEVIFVKDNGIGIESQHLAKIFSLFEKLDQNSEGTGIGLALIKRIIETHGGKIWVESDGPGKGSTFFFTIPDGRKNPQPPLAKSPKSDQKF
ncbi:MAG TPA: ATP-binding protein [Anaerolineales bacterium]|nr:ATP-binding protein [Anaerolineales bacterium]